MSYQLKDPSKIAKPNCYFTDCDLGSQRMFLISKQELREKLHLLTILNEKVIFAVSSFFRSNITADVIAGERPLLEHKILVPALRRPHRTFETYLNERQESLLKSIRNSFGEKTIFDSMDAHENLQMKCSLLEDLTSQVVSWQHIPTVKEFRAGFRRDLVDPASPLKKRLIKEPLIYEELIQKVDEITSREEIEKFCISRFSKKPGDYLLGYINVNYHLAGATAVRSDPVVHYRELGFFRERYARAVPSDYENIKVFKKLLESLAISSKSLRELGYESILQIRKDPITSRFRRKYRKVLDFAREGELSKVKEGISSYLPAKKEMIEAIESEVSAEKTKEKRFRISRATLEVVAYLTNVLSFLTIAPSPIGAAAGVISGVGTVRGLVDPFLSKLHERIGCEFIIFAQRYRNAILKY